MPAAVLRSSDSTLRSIVRWNEVAASIGLKKNVPPGARCDVTTSAVNAGSPTSCPNSAWTMRPRSNTTVPSPEASARTRCPVLPPSAMAWATSARSMSGMRARLTMRSGRSRSSIVSANEPLITADTSVSPATASAFCRAATVPRSGSMSSSRAIALRQRRDVHEGDTLGHPRAAGRAEFQHGVDRHSDVGPTASSEQTEEWRQAGGAVAQSTTQIHERHDAATMHGDAEDRRVVAGYRGHHGDPRDLRHLAPVHGHASIAEGDDHERAGV